MPSFRASAALPLGLPRHQGILALDSGERLNGMGATDRLCAHFGETEVLDVALVNQIFHGPCHVFDRHVGVDTVLIEEVNRLDTEPLERALDHLLDVLGPTSPFRP